jgi:hypothetical protein
MSQTIHGTNTQDRRWTWNEEESTLHHLRADGKTEDIFVTRKKPNRFHHSHCQPHSNLNTVCSVEPTLSGESWCLTLSEPRAKQDQMPTSFLDILRLWGNKHLALGAPTGFRGGHLDTQIYHQRLAGGHYRRVVDPGDIPQSVLSSICDGMLQGARMHRGVILRNAISRKRIQRRAPWPNGNPPDFVKQKQVAQ